MILTAIVDMDGRYQENKADAKKWMYSGGRGPQSFLWICSILELDSARIQTACMTRRGRKTIMRVYQKEAKRAKKAEALAKKAEALLDGDEM